MKLILKRESVKADRGNIHKSQSYEHAVLEATGKFYSYKATYASCKLSKGSHFLLFHEKESKMNKIHEKENLRGLQFCLPVTYHRDLAILECVISMGHVNVGES